MCSLCKLHRVGTTGQVEAHALEQRLPQQLLRHTQAYKCSMHEAVKECALAQVAFDFCVTVIPFKLTYSPHGPTICYLSCIVVILFPV